MNGFWAGAVPPWAFVALVVLVILVIGGIALGSWYGYGRGFAHAEEEARWAREQAKARRTHPIYRQPPAMLCPNCAYGRLRDTGLGTGTLQCDYCRQSAALDGMSFKHVNPPPAITTGEIQAITDETDIMVARWKADNDLWMAEHGLSDT